MSPRTGVVALVALALVAAGCGDAANSTSNEGAPTTVTAEAISDTSTDTATVPTTPREPTTTTPSTIDPAPSTTTTTAATAPPQSLPTVGEIADGNQILMIGDSILAATASRFGGAMCRELVPLGWQVLLEAEVSRPIDFAAVVQRSVDANLPDIDWDAGLIFLGTNYYGQASSYLRQLDRAIQYFGDAPVVLVTITEYDQRIPAANRAIETVARKHTNVSIIDWREVTADRPQLLVGDGIHPNDRGRAVLIDLISERLGKAPSRPGRCLPSTFIDDAELPDGVMPTTTVTSSPRPGTTTTTVPAGGTTTTAPRSTTTSPTMTTTVAPPTSPVTTAAPPPPTAAPASAPPDPLTSNDGKTVDQPNG